jgi:hypothetical protein
MIHPQYNPIKGLSWPLTRRGRVIKGGLERPVKEEDKCGTVLMSRLNFWRSSLIKLL